MSDHPLIIHPDRGLQVVLARLLSKLFGITLIAKVKISPSVEIKVILPEPSSEIIYKSLPYEEDVVAFMKKILRKNSVFYDIGAHIGYHSLGALTIVGDRGLVVAFEPTEAVFVVLKDNLRNYKNAFPINKAVGDGKQKRQEFLDFGGKFSSFNTLISPRLKGLPDPKPVMVEVVSLDRFLESGYRIPDLLKIDVENGEFAILSGAVKLLKKYSPAVIIEGGDIGRVEAQSTASCLKFLKNIGYIFYEYDYNQQEVIKHEPRIKYKSLVNILAVKEK